VGLDAWHIAMNSGVQAITFDVGGTLIEPWPSVGHVYAAVAAEFGIRDVAAGDLDLGFANAWTTRQRFDHSRDAWREVVTRTFSNAGQTLAPSCFDAIYNRFARASAWRIFDDVLPTLDQIKGHGLKLGIISNWDERLRRLLKELRLLDWFDVVTISHEVGHSKPARAIFENAATRLSLAPHEIVHVGDSESDDAAGARAAGFKGFLVKRNSPSPREISTLAAALPALDALSGDTVGD
jgi:putative hydrolase of the HAD superfamily